MSELPPPVAERVREIVNRGVELWTEDDGLCFLAPPDVPAADIRAALRPAREHLIALLAGGKRLAPALFIERGRVAFAGEPGAIRTLTFDIIGPLDESALQTALTTLVARHDALRLAYPSVGGGHVRLLHPPMSVPIARYDGDEPRHPPRPNPGRPPLLTAALMRRGAAEHILVLTVHTLAVDGMSLALLLQELGTLYDAAVADRPHGLPEAPSSQRQVRREHAYLASPDAAAAREYWAGRLAAAPALRLRPGGPGKAGSLPIVVPEPLTSAVRARAAAERTTPFAVLLAAYGLVMEEVTGCTDMTVAVPVGNRWHPDDEHTLSGARDLLLLRLSLGVPAADAIAATHRERLGAMSHGRLPFEALPPRLTPPRRPGRNPVFGAVFALQTIGESFFLRLRGLEVTLRHLAVPPLDAGMDFGLILWPQDGELRGELGCDGVAVDAGELPAVGRRFLVILEQLAEGRSARVRPEDIRDVLVAEPAVADAALDEREGRVIAYVALSTRADPVAVDRLRRRLAAHHPAPLLVPVTRLPRDAEGDIDLAALRKVPVTDPATLARWEAELSARAGTLVQVDVAPRDPATRGRSIPRAAEADPVAAQEVTVTMPAPILDNASLVDRFGTRVVPRPLIEE